MNILFYIIAAALFFALSSRFYARYIARSLGEDDKNPNPAQVYNDGRDYVPTRKPVVFAHHFSAIAGAGPIIGPTMAILYGFIPAWLWVVFGGIMIGAVHDFTVLLGNYILIVTDLILLCLSLGVIVFSIKIFRKPALRAGAA